MSIRIGIVGTGFGAQVHAPILQRHPDFDLVAIASQRPERASQAASMLHIPDAFDDWRQMLAEASIECVVFATRPSDHKVMTLSALSAGLHVLCEKPPALNLSEAETMEQAAKLTDRVASMNFEWRYLPERLAVKRILKEEQLGRILHVNWSEVWQLWGRIQEFNAGWDSQKEQGGGMLGAIGSHIIDALCHWFGEAASVTGITMNHVPLRKSGTDWVPTTADDSFSFICIFRNEVTCAVNCTIASVGRPPYIEIVGEQGTLRIQGHQIQIATTTSPDFGPVFLEKTMDASEFPAEIQGYVHAQWHLYTDLAKSIAGESSAHLPSLEDAVRVQAIMDSIRG
ncbi:Gfo/Idh/MocA family protein [Alicyclobacillus sp. SO9]|uniref:Gfo/Idh/MocA family protein n=1 Tax=Alicyclobacillus sp. SO9 TaxID=2665646 RepID=UPI0018E8F61F|nr:Gfo/Idh/MocA family oxidoreductase [Alicyclobacillus sp. SO9]QQE79126.1 Gfo/Idh/MocA family oxidoreductase [Alicyclobacillus sp. SO9]